MLTFNLQIADYEEADLLDNEIQTLDYDNFRSRSLARTLITITKVFAIGSGLENIFHS